MTSFLYDWNWDFSNQMTGTEIRRNCSSRRRCSAQYSTRTGIYFSVGAIFLAVLATMPTSAMCRPFDEIRLVNDSNRHEFLLREDAHSSREHFEEALLGSRFEFQRKKVPSFVEENKRENNNENEESLGLVRINENDDDFHNPLLLNNSGMIVHVIVTSSSSSSSSRATSSSSEIVETETDSSDNNDHDHEHVQFSVAEDSEKSPFVSTSVSSTSETSKTVTDIPPNQNQETEIRNADKLELKKIQQANEPGQDIFFPFYRAFSHDSSSSTFSSTAPSLPGDQPVTIFRLNHSQPQNFQLNNNGGREQQRRRFSRVRQVERRKALLQRQTAEESAVEETKRKLELLSSKLDKSSRIISPSASKIAVSVAVTKSVAASSDKGRHRNVAGGGGGGGGHTITPYLQLQTERIHGPQTAPFAPPQSSTPTLKSSFPASSLFETSASRHRPITQRRNKVRTRTVSSEIGDPSSSSSKLNLNRIAHTSPTTTPRTKINWQEPAKLWGEPAQIWGEPAKVWGEPERVWGEPAKVWGDSETVWGQQTRRSTSRKDHDGLMQSDQPPEDKDAAAPVPQGSFVILGDDETEGDSIDGDLGRPLMLHHFTINGPGNKKEEKSKSVSVSTSVSSSVSGPTSRKVQGFQDHQAQASQPHSHHHQFHFQHHQVLIGSSNKPQSSSSNVSATNVGNDKQNQNSEDLQQQEKKNGKKFGYVIEGANVRKYRVEERTPDGYIVGEYGVLNNQNAFLRGVRYTADGTINPRLIHEALLKFLSLR